MANTQTGRTWRILVVGKDPEILKTVLRLLNDFRATRYEAIGAANAEEARQLFDTGDIDLALLTNGLDSSETQELRSWFNNRKPGVRVLQHYGGGSGLLFNELTYSLTSHPSTHGTDDIA